jgi:hypothetical protein
MPTVLTKSDTQTKQTVVVIGLNSHEDEKKVGQRIKKEGWDGAGSCLKDMNFGLSAAFI